MSIKKACELDLSSGRLIGFVDLGNGQEPHDADNIPLATEALVFMVVGLAAPWKMPFRYFLNAGLSGEVIKNLLLEAVHCIQECGLKVTAIVCDCLMANVAMVKLLWCRVHELTFENLRTSFPNPQFEEEEIFVMFDPCHALKLLRNLLGDKNILWSETYGAIEWRYIVLLNELQEREGLRAGNKLSRAHVEYYRQIMKVKLAAQTFSASISKALVFALELGEPGFDGCCGTAEFISMVDRSPVAKGFKAPLRPSTLCHQREFMELAGRQLMGLRLESKKPVVEDGRRMSVISLAFTLKSVSQLATKMFEKELCRYLCTSHLNQDPLEMYFSCIRQRGGWNNNPSASQFRHAYRKTLVHAVVACSMNANATPQL
ncbi:hypothetical protein HPB49_009281 [Dermacentor silvarum]|uniref:Uncharacterized protein n=1 Tax=Dermacentor silvarum TaxID=543639 RepID=A0ACB8DXX7_DERSI|nr:hypothetical protein HPB49_009281 [Dermacentor silvarum]